MDILSIRQQLKIKSLYDIPLRVTFYARVSSESDEQLNSLGNQIQYYETMIRKNTAWTFVPGYIDEGLSGISTKHRENFNRMIDDASADQFDLILTKEISRFARNTLDSIQYTRQLLNHGVGVFFQNDNINTFDEDSELRLSIMSSIAQDELRKLSSRVKFGHQQAIKNNVVLGNNRIFGYRKDKKRLVIDEEQAPMVRELFQLYASDQYSMKQIETLFWEKGYRNLNGKKIAHSTMANMISNPKYKGYYVGNKVKVVDMFTKKQKFLPPEEWVRRSYLRNYGNKPTLCCADAAKMLKLVKEFATMQICSLVNSTAPVVVRLTIAGIPEIVKETETASGSALEKLPTVQPPVVLSLFTNPRSNLSSLRSFKIQKRMRTHLLMNI